MNIIKGILISAIALSATCASAQNAKHSVSAIADANRNFSHYYAGMSFWTMPNALNATKRGFHVGASYAFNITRYRRPLFLQVGGEYNFVNKTTHNSEGDYSESFGSVALPISFLYRIEYGMDQYVAPFFGPNLRFNTSSECGLSNDWGKATNDYLEADLVNVFQVGLNMGLTIDTGMLAFTYRFVPDLSNYYDAKMLNKLNEDISTKTKSRTNSHMITIGITL